MDRYEATKVVFSRIQKLDPDNASKIMGLLLIQDHGEKEMIRLAFGPENLLHSVILKARQELGISPSSSPSPFPFSSSITTTTTTTNSTTNNNRSLPLSMQQNSSSPSITTSASNSPRFNFLPNGLKIPPSLSISNLNSPSSATAAANSPSSISWGNSVFPDFHRSPDELISPSHHNPSTPNYFPSSTDHLSFLNDPQSDCSNNDDSLYATSSPVWSDLQHRRSYSVSDINLGYEDPSGGLGWKPCLYYARGFCKNGAGCRFVHHHNQLGSGGLVGDPDSVLVGSPNKAEVMEQCHELLISKSLQHQKLLAASQFMASAGGTGSGSFSYSGGNNSCSPLSFLAQQHSENQRVAALRMGEDMNKFSGRSSSRLNRGGGDYLINGGGGGGDSNPGSRQIYLTFPADSTFREEDVSNYFSIFGPVQDVRIPYQQKRMFGFVTFCFPETVRLILAKGNPHFVCDARVLVKPYKEKGKVPDKFRKQQLQQLERDFSACSSPTGLDGRDHPFDHPFGSRMMYSNAQDLLWRRKLEEQADMQQALELQSRRLMALTLDTKRSHHHRALSTGAASFPSPSSYSPGFNNQHSYFSSSSEQSSPDACDENGCMLAVENDNNHREKEGPGPVKEDCGSSSSGKESALEDNTNLPDSLDHNLPDSPFASSTKGAGECFVSSGMLSNEASDMISSAPASSALFPATSNLDMASFKSCYFQMPSLSSGHGAIGM